MDRSPDKSVILKIGSRKQLFIDDYVIDRLEGEYIVRVLNQPEKYPGNPILEADRPWEHSLLLGSVIYDEEDRIFKMWYSTWNPPWYGYSNEEASLVCYATSIDGIHWHKPSLGIIEFRGSKDNNIVMKSYNRGVARDGTPYQNAWIGRILYLDRVFKDVDDPDPERRYKMSFWDATERGEGICIAFSPDGIHWRRYEGNPVCRVNAPHDAFSIMHDEEEGRYIAFPNLLFEEGLPEFNMRKIGRCESRDFIHWTEPELILMPDEEDHPHTPENAPWPYVQFYNITAFNYEGLYLGLLAYYRADPKDQTMDAQLTVSRDSYRWLRAGDRYTFLPNGPRGSWDEGMISDISPPIIIGNIIYLYYGGTDGPHYSNFSKSRIGLATLRLDGFVSIDAVKEGVLTTKPLTFKGTRLEINAEIRRHAAVQDWRGYVKVEVQDDRGRAIPGYSAEECDPFTGDSVHHIVTWRGNPDVSPLQDRPVRLKFHMRRAKLYSFRFFTP